MPSPSASLYVPPASMRDSRGLDNAAPATLPIKILPIVPMPAAVAIPPVAKEAMMPMAIRGMAVPRVSAPVVVRYSGSSREPNPFTSQEGLSLISLASLMPFPDSCRPRATSVWASDIAFPASGKKGTGPVAAGMPIAVSARPTGVKGNAAASRLRLASSCRMAHSMPAPNCSPKPPTPATKLRRVFSAPSMIPLAQSGSSSLGISGVGGGGSYLGVEGFDSLRSPSMACFHSFSWRAELRSNHWAARGPIGGTLERSSSSSLCQEGVAVSSCSSAHFLKSSASLTRRYSSGSQDHHLLAIAH